MIRFLRPSLSFEGEVQGSYVAERLKASSSWLG